MWGFHEETLDWSGLTRNNSRLFHFNWGKLIFGKTSGDDNFFIVSVNSPRLAAYLKWKLETLINYKSYVVLWHMWWFWSMSVKYDTLWELNKYKCWCFFLSRNYLSAPRDLLPNFNQKLKCRESPCQFFFFIKITGR